MYTITIFSVLAGVIGTGAGGLIGLLFKNKGNKPVSCVLSFAGGVMISVVLFDLVPEATKIAVDAGLSFWVILVALLGGMAIIALLNFFIETKRTKNKFSKNKLLNSGIVMAIAIGLHNLPEGIALGSSGSISTANAVAITVLLGLHNMPEGMAITVPLLSGGQSAKKSVAAAFLSGSVTVLGALIGFFAGNISPAVICVSLSFAAGAMTYVSFTEVFYQAYSLFGGKLTYFYAVIGIVIGMLVIFLI